MDDKLARRQADHNALSCSYRKCAGVMLHHRLTRRFRAGALVDRELRFFDSYEL
jgi:hypothetical protein